MALMVAAEARHTAEVVVASRPGDSFLEWFLSEAHALQLLPEHPTLDGARGSPLTHEILSAKTIEQLPAEASIEGFVERMRALLRLPERVRPWIAGLKQRRGHGRVAARSLCAAEVVEATLRRLHAAGTFLGKTPLARDQFAQLLGDDLRSAAASATMLQSVLPFQPHALGTLLAGDCSRLIVPRAIEGNLPGRASEALFFNGWQEASIRRIFPDAEDLHARESFAFETLLRKCRGEVTLLIPATTDSGTETIPSPFVDRFLLPGQEPGLLPTCVLPPAGEGRDREELAQLAGIEAARIAGEAPLKSRFKAHLGILASAEAKQLIRDRYRKNELNPSALQRYANCPFSFFVRDVLRIDESAEETPQLRATDQGGLLHEILARFYRDHREEALAFRAQKLSEEKVAALLGKIAATLKQEQQQDLDYTSPALLERDVAETVRMALAAIVAEADEARHISSPLIPAAFEWAFGAEHGTALALPIAGEEPLLIRGRVDRVDLDRDQSRFLVIDYKMGKSDQVVNRIESGEHLQLPLYIRAVKQGLFPKALPLGGLLLEIKESSPAADEKKTAGKTKGLVLGEFDGACYRLGRSHAKVSEERLEALLQAAAERAVEYAVEIRKGVFPAISEAKCDTCDYGDICRHKTVSAD